MGDIGVHAANLAEYVCGDEISHICADIAATVAFVTAPMVAYWNHKAILNIAVPLQYQPGTGLKVYSALCIGILSIFAMAYLYLRFFVT